MANFIIFDLMSHNPISTYHEQLDY